MSFATLTADNNYSILPRVDDNHEDIRRAEASFQRDLNRAARRLEQFYRRRLADNHSGLLEGEDAYEAPGDSETAGEGYDTGRPTVPERLRRRL